MQPGLNRVLVTGASRGLGAALADAFAARGYDLFLAARDETALQAHAQRLRLAHGGRVACRHADLRDVRSCRTLAAAAEQALGGIDVLVNNAGFGSFKPFPEWPEQETLDALAVNLAAPVLLVHALLPGMLARGRGDVVNVASDLARRPLANMAPYVASKAGLLGFGASLHREVRDRGVRVTTVMPGIIDSAFNGAREGSKEPRWALPPAQVAQRIVDLIELPRDVVIDELVIHPATGDY
jgi:hypothetical protein